MNRQEVASKLVALAKKLAVAPPGWEGTVLQMKKHPEIDNPWALAWSEKNKGYEPHYADGDEILGMRRRARLTQKRVRLTKRTAAIDGLGIVKDIAKTQSDMNKDLNKFHDQIEKQSLDMHGLFGKLVAFVKQHPDKASEVAEALRESVYTGELESRGVDLIERLSGEKIFPPDASGMKNQPKWAFVTYR